MMVFKESPRWNEASSLDYSLEEGDWQEIGEPNETLLNVTERIRSWFRDDWKPIHHRMAPFTLREDYESRLAIIYENPDHQFVEPGKASIRDVLRPNFHSIIDWRCDNIDDQGTTQLRLEREINGVLSPTAYYCNEILLMFNKIVLERGQYRTIPQRVPVIGGKGRLIGGRWEVQPQILVADLILVNQLEELQNKLQSNVVPQFKLYQRDYKKMTAKIKALQGRQPLF